MTSYLRRHARDIRGGVIHLWWVFVIVMPLCGFVLYLAIDYTNAKAARQQQHTNALVAYSINKGACGFRDFVQPVIKRAIKRRKDYPTMTAGQRALNENSIKTARRFLDTQVTIPASFECSTLTNKPPRS